MLCTGRNVYHMSHAPGSCAEVWGIFRLGEKDFQANVSGVSEGGFVQKETCHILSRFLKLLIRKIHWCPEVLKHPCALAYQKACVVWKDTCVRGCLICPDGWRMGLGGTFGVGLTLDPPVVRPVG
jgi:hypothetical protein